MPEYGKAAISVMPATGSDARTADERWASLRPNDHANLHWKWVEILPRWSEQFCIRLGAELVGLWVGKGDITIAPHGLLYRLDYIEVDPTVRGGTFGYFAYALVAARARERGCSGLAIPSLPETVKVHERMGAVPLPEWNLSPPLAPYRMMDEAFDRLLDSADEHEEEV